MYAAVLHAPVLNSAKASLVQDQPGETGACSALEASSKRPSRKFDHAALLYVYVYVEEAGPLPVTDTCIVSFITRCAYAQGRVKRLSPSIYLFVCLFVRVCVVKKHGCLLSYRSKIATK